MSNMMDTKTGGSFALSLPPHKIFLVQGFQAVINFRVWGAVFIPTGVATAAGHEPQERQ